MKQEAKSENETDAKEDLSNKPRTPFTAEQLNTKWKSYTYRVQKEKRIRVYAALSKREPDLKQNFEIEFTIDSSAQQTDLDNERPALLAYLRSELNNYGISLKVLLTESDDSSMKYLSGKDRFLQMAEKNNSLHDLREKLGLDIEY